MSGIIPTAVLEQIRAASDITEIIGASVPLKRAGASFKGLCPFHKEKSPSFHVNPQRQTYHCFGCNKGGDVFRFVQEYESLSFVEAVKRLAERARIPLQFDEKGSGPGAFVKDNLLELHEQVTQRWQMALAGDAGAQAARDYLGRRAVSPDAVKLFRIGYAPEQWDDTVNWALGKGFDLALVEQAGLIIRKEGTDRLYDRFRGRLMFPICDEQGRVIAFSGRVLNPEQSPAKYVNSPETPIFTKGRVFFGLDKSKRPILEAGFAVICEGQLDLIACYMAGVKNIVAAQGTAFTPEHARILRRYVSEVVLCFDADEAGHKAAVRVLDSLLGVGMAIKVALVPAPHDPDSYIKEQGAEAFQGLIKGAPGFFDYYLDRLCSQNDLHSDVGRLRLLREYNGALQKTGNAVLIDNYAQKAALRLAVTANAVREEFNKPQPQAQEYYREEDVMPSEPELPPPPPKESWLLKLLFRNDFVVEWTAAHLDVEWLQHPVVRRAIAARLYAETSGEWHGVAAMLSEVNDPAMSTLITEALADPRNIPGAEQQTRDLVKALRDQMLDARSAEIGRELGQPGLSDADHVRLLQQRLDLKKARQQPLQPLGEG
jgi:DNA primase